MNHVLHEIVHFAFILFILRRSRQELGHFDGFCGDKDNWFLVPFDQNEAQLCLTMRFRPLSTACSSVFQAWARKHPLASSMSPFKFGGSRTQVMSHRMLAAMGKEVLEFGLENSETHTGHCFH